jgi:hypothetical protein
MLLKRRHRSLNTLKESLSRAQEEALLFSKRLHTAESQVRDLHQMNDDLHAIDRTVIQNLRNDGALLPSVVRWTGKLQEMLDDIMVKRLLSPPHPAPAAATQVREAKAQARQNKQAADILRNQVDLYTAQAPWLAEYAEYSIDEF